MVCKHCNGNKVEDEYHFLIKCTKYEIQRNVLLLKSTSECPTIEHLHGEDRFIYMPSAGIETVKHVAAFIYNTLQYTVVEWFCNEINITVSTYCTLPTSVYLSMFRYSLGNGQ